MSSMGPMRSAMRRDNRRLLVFSCIFLGCLVSAAFLPGCDSRGSTTGVSTTGISTTNETWSGIGTSEVTLPESVPADFAFFAAYGVWAKNQFDTFRGTFTKDIVSQNKPNPTVDLRLTADELATLYQDLRAMKILDYSSAFLPTTGTTMSTYTSYILNVRAAGTIKYISWDDKGLSTEPRATALRKWFEKLQGMIEAKPEYSSLPAAEGGYF
jgi:hypothetical protein